MPLKNEMVETEGGHALALPAGAGMHYEGEDTADLVLPHLLLMQSNSKFVKAPHKKTVGNFVNGMTLKESSSVEFVPAVYLKQYDGLKKVGTKMEFEFRTFSKDDPRLAGRSFFKDKQTGEKGTARSTMVFISLVDGMPVIIPFSSTSYQTGKKLYTMWKFSKQPLFSTKYKLTATEHTNSEGSFYVKEVETLGPASAEEIALASDIFKLYASRATDTAAASADGADEVPF